MATFPMGEEGYRTSQASPPQKHNVGLALGETAPTKRLNEKLFTAPLAESIQSAEV